MIKKVLKKTLPEPVKNWLSDKFFYCQLKKVQQHHRNALKKIRKKEKIKVVFFLMHEPAWKCESLYVLFARDKRFEPTLIINPFWGIGEENMLKEMNLCYDTFKKRGYSVIKTFNEKTGQWLNVKKDIQPDLVFFSNPYNLTKKEYYINSFLNVLTCYIPYGYMLANIQNSQFNLPFHNFVWRGFYETPIHKMMAEKYARNKGHNILSFGFPMCDIFRDESYNPSDVWKIKDSSVKRVIWAPHHTIENNENILAYSNFLVYHQFMFDILKQFKGKLQIAFKPHPKLKFNLYNHPDWGKQKTDSYYNSWQTLENGQLEEEGYVDLFLTSDALILDSISFITEYFFINKPGLFIVRNKTIQNKFNEFGKMAFDLVYKAYEKEDVLAFLIKNVLGGDDRLMKKRTIFRDQYLIPQNKKFAGQNIYEYILNEFKS